MRGREVALPESLRELWAKWISAGRIAVTRVDQRHSAHFDRLSANGRLRWQNQIPVRAELVEA
jgi:hypothetical protein